jgi:CubicO group peptidase (beta-lactamase class C family)
MEQNLWKSIEAAICCVALAASGCASVTPNPGTDRDAGRSEAAGQAKPERLDTDTPKVTVAGNTFVAPAGWTFVVRGPATILEAPEGGSFVAIVDVKAADSHAALVTAWAAYKPDAKWPLKSTSPVADRDGWTDRTAYNYQTSPNERRDVDADIRRANDIWTVTISDMDQGVGEKRLAQVSLIYGKFLPKGYQRESFAGKRAHTLDTARIAELSRFVGTAMKETGVPGVSLGLYQDRKVVFAGGFGVRELGKPAKVDAETRYMIASNTKALVTLMLAELVDAKKMAWDTPAISLLPTFKLGDPQTTDSVLVKHLICACTGMPRQDLEWLFEYQDMTPESAMTLLGTMQPTSPFGALFQYSNMMAAAAGYIGGHIVSPDLELGSAYDKAMQSYVFDPLHMTNTTQDFAKAQQGDFATAHAPDIDGHMALAEGRVNLSVVPIRPAGGAWSTVEDVLKYVAMELDDGKLPDGTQYVSKDALLARRAPQVPIGVDQTYGMGLIVDTVYGTPVVHHGGDMIGFHSDMMWLPEHGVGAVVLTNGDPGWLIRSVFRRKLLEVLFDGKPEADGQIVAQAKQFYEEMAGDRKLLTVPADIAASQALAPHYSSASLGQITVVRDANRLSFDFGAYSSEMASRVNPDGTTSLVTIAPGINGSEFVIGHAGGKRTLTLRDAQHEYIYQEK